MARPSLARSAWGGARAGMRVVTFVVGPFVVFILIVLFALAALSWAAGRGLGVHQNALKALGFYLLCVTWGAILGALLGTIGGVIRRALPDSRAAAWLVGANRPIRLRRVTRTPIDPAASRRFWRRLLFWLVGVPAMGIIAAAVGTGVYAKRTVDRRMADAIAAADRDDPAWRLEDLIARREPVPDEENSAFVVADALALLPENWPLAGPIIPGHPSPAPTLIQASLERLNARANNGRLDDATANTIRSELEAHAEAVRRARTLADYRRGRHEIDVGPTIIDTLLPDTQATRNAARLLSLDAAIRAHDGDIDAALDSARAIIGVGRSIGDEPFVWPASVAEIDPTILPNSPVDPYTGHAFHVEHRDRQLVIYSLGANLRDEHGEFDLKLTKRGARDDVNARAWDVALRRQPPPADPEAP